MKWLLARLRRLSAGYDELCSRCKRPIGPRERHWALLSEEQEFRRGALTTLGAEAVLVLCQACTEAMNTEACWAPLQQAIDELTGRWKS